MSINISKGDLVVHNSDDKSSGIPMEVLAVKHDMVYCKHRLNKEDPIYLADWYPAAELKRIRL